MAPFGKNFLKARLKNRTKDAEPIAGKEIQVTVCSEEKVVCGVTKHTTCADMIQALLEDHRGVPESKRLLHGEAKDFCLVERWKGFERALPPLTRILRLWYAWGDQRPAIQFVLLRTCDFVPQQPAKAAKAKAARPKRWEHSRGKHPQALPAEKQKRLVKKAFRKLERLHQESRAAPGAEEVDRMVQLILNQDHTIRQQIQRMRELDVELENVEAQAQQEEAETGEAAQASGRSMEVRGAEQLQEYLFASDGVERLELQVQRHRELIQQLSHDIDAELRRAGLPLGWEEGGAAAAAIAAAAPSEADESFYAAQLERLQGELQHSLLAGVALHTQAAEVDKQLQQHEAALLSKDQECWQLAAHLDALQLTAAAEETPSGCGAAESESPCGVAQPKTGKHGLSPLDATDTDSDTGISSTHSQDSLSPCLDFPPPLDTDV